MIHLLPEVLLLNDGCIAAPPRSGTPVDLLAPASLGKNVDGFTGDVINKKN